MTGVVVMVAICAVSVVFLVYVFAALSKEGRRGPCRVMRIWRYREQDELEIPSIDSRDATPIDARARGQHPFGVAERRPIRVGR